MGDMVVTEVDEYQFFHQRTCEQWKKHLSRTTCLNNLSSVSIALKTPYVILFAFTRQDGKYELNLLYTFPDFKKA